jgi:hypothetical protein
MLLGECASAKGGGRCQRLPVLVACTSMLFGLIAFSMTCFCAHCVQAALMGVVSSAVAALDANRGIAEVVSAGLCFLQNLAMAPENQVTLAMMQCCGR